LKKNNKTKKYSRPAPTVATLSRNAETAEKAQALKKSASQKNIEKRPVTPSGTTFRNSFGGNSEAKLRIGVETQTKNSDSNSNAANSIEATLRPKIKILIQIRMHN
jgi:hypothetical protein